MKIFNENSPVSWRKILTFISGLIFFIACIGYLYSNGFKKELPTSYQAIIGGVFAFYFAKELIRNTKIISEEKDETAKG